MKKNGWRLGVFLSLFVLAGCATVGYEDHPPVPGTATQQGVYHKVRRGETLWKIAKAYQVEVSEIIRSNNIPDAASIEDGQLLFIPGRDQVREIGAAVASDSNQDEFMWPIRGHVIQYFGERKNGYLLKGIGIQGQIGENVVAAREGSVVFADYLPGYAYTVMLDHHDGYVSVYSMNSKLLVNRGEDIRKGIPLAQVGKKGDQPFLYFEIRKDTSAQNPLYYLPK